MVHLQHYIPSSSSPPSTSHHHHHFQISTLHPTRYSISLILLSSLNPFSYPDHHHHPFRTIQPRSFRVFRPSHIHKLDSVAGATGTSVAQLPGRHILVPPWASILVYSVILSFLIVESLSFFPSLQFMDSILTQFFLIFHQVTGAGFVLSYNARREFRQRVADQQAAAELDEANKPPSISQKEFNSFTRQSILILNSARQPSTYNPPFRLSYAGDPFPVNAFDRPSRNSVVIAQIVPGLETSSDDFYRFRLVFSSSNSLSSLQPSPNSFLSPLSHLTLSSRLPVKAPNAIAFGSLESLVPSPLVIFKIHQTSMPTRILPPNLPKSSMGSYGNEVVIQSFLVLPFVNTLHLPRNLHFVIPLLIPPPPPLLIRLSPRRSLPHHPLSS